MDDPRGGAWWEVEDVVAHTGSGAGSRYLVRYKGFPAAFDECKSKRDATVSDALVKSYRSLLGDGDVLGRLIRADRVRAGRLARHGATRRRRPFARILLMYLREYHHYYGERETSLVY
jgi:hypothetical protein